MKQQAKEKDMRKQTTEYTKRLIKYDPIAIKRNNKRFDEIWPEMERQLLKQAKETGR